MPSESNKLTAVELAVFGMLAAMMYGSKILMQALPNIHLLGLFIVTETIVFRRKALIPLYTYIFLDGLFSGFAMWWLPYLYVWTVLWGAVMLLPKKMPPKVAAPVYALVCGLHGLAFGTLYAPGQALLFGLNAKATLAWIVAGLPFDAIHGLSNLVAGTLILPFASLLRKLVYKN